jgi:aspartate ammonia-lyase
MELPDDLYYGVQTKRASDNFPISGCPVARYPLYIECLGRIKRAAAMANKACGALEPAIADAIAAAADKVIKGDFLDQFPLDIFQGGGFTSQNMNMNEVLAHLANEALTGHKGYDRVHPNTHVNKGQSTNDVMPSALRLFCAPAIDALVAELEATRAVLATKEKEFADVVKVGRTCLQDALPITLGQEFSGYKCFVERQIEAFVAIRPECFVLTVGGTAIGTGVGAFPGYADAFYRFLSEDLGENARSDANLYDGMQNVDFYVRLHALVKSTACGLSKIARDMRLLSSGPRAGLGEITLPAVQAGSSIMPGKINPVMPEVVNQVAYQICGNDMAVTMAVEGGELDLNVWEPVHLKNIGESFMILTNALREFTGRCLAGVTANRAACARDSHNTLALATVVSAILGYEEGVRVAQYAEKKNLSVHEAVLELGLMNEQDADKLLDPMLLTDPGKSAALCKSNYRL